MQQKSGKGRKSQMRNKGTCKGAVVTQPSSGLWPSNGHQALAIQWWENQEKEDSPEGRLEGGTEV